MYYFNYYIDYLQSVVICFSLQVLVYKGHKAEVGEAPLDIPSDGCDSIYSYETLPKEHWKKYIYAARFVSLVRAKTPKITLYTDQAKCYLMENSPSNDFEAVFYTGNIFFNILCFFLTSPIFNNPSQLVYIIQYPPYSLVAK